MVDILVLFILYSLPARKKAVVNLLVTKIKKKLFTEDLLGRVFSIGSSVSAHTHTHTCMHANTHTHTLP